MRPPLSPLTSLTLLVPETRDGTVTLPSPPDYFFLSERSVKVKYSGEMSVGGSSSFIPFERIEKIIFHLFVSPINVIIVWKSNNIVFVVYFHKIYKSLLFVSFVDVFVRTCKLVIF